MNASVLPVQLLEIVAVSDVLLEMFADRWSFHQLSMFRLGNVAELVGSGGVKFHVQLLSGWIVAHGFDVRGFDRVHFHRFTIE